jgi:hypothetical protein
MTPPRNTYSMVEPHHPNPHADALSNRPLGLSVRDDDDVTPEINLV